MSYYGDQTNCENLDSVSQLKIGQAGFLLKDPRILVLFSRFDNNINKAIYFNVIIKFDPCI